MLARNILYSTLNDKSEVLTVVTLTVIALAAAPDPVAEVLEAALVSVCVEAEGGRASKRGQRGTASSNPEAELRASLGDRLE